MRRQRISRIVALALTALLLLTSGSAFAEGAGKNGIGNTLDSNEGGLYANLIGGRKVARQAYLSDRYPTTDEALLVFHNEWKAGSWYENKSACRSSGTMMLAGETCTKGIGFYVSSEAFRSSAEGTEATGIVQYTLNGDYDEFYFCIGPDNSDSRYCAARNGTARLQIFADDVLVYETDFFDYDDSGYDQAIKVTGVSKLKIALTERRGSYYTLNVVLANPLLVDFA